MDIRCPCREIRSSNTWTAQWVATSLPKGKYLIGVQAVDDNTMVDDGATPTGIDNRRLYVTEMCPIKF